jgi:hypothetical protein
MLSWVSQVRPFLANLGWFGRAIHFSRPNAHIPQSASSFVGPELLFILMRAKRAVPILLVVLLASLLAGAQESAPKTSTPDASAKVPTISADRGDCTAAFDVRDDQGKPAYQAAIHALVRWGLAHKSDLTVSTNYYGKAEFTGLPNYSKKPIQFDITAGDKKRTVSFDPGNQCHANFTVEMR